MSFHRRVRTVYVKELVDILRDRRTLIAMIVVPIVLYPLLMLGSIQAISIQSKSMAGERILIGLLNDPQQWSALSTLATKEVAYLMDRERLNGTDDEDAEIAPTPIKESAKQIYFNDVESIKAAVQARQIQLGLVFEGEISREWRRTNVIKPYYDKEDIRSLSAYRRVQDMVERASKSVMSARKKDARVPSAFDRPFTIEAVDLSSPPSILGQILPLILVLMTITGAIYPAIDLTAGERERGTLETLMVCPVPTIDLIFGKFLVVTTIAIMGATLNLGSVCATVYFGGFDAFVGTGGGRVPYGQLLLILLCLIPFAVLMSAIMLAVCSFARTFKEAQNYVTPVIMAVLIPGGLAALPATRLDGLMLVIPVGNMVLLSRELLVGAQIPASAFAMVLLSTMLYATAAVAVAAKVFGKESVVFADAGSIRGVLTRRLIKPSGAPTLTMALMTVSLLFPAWFFVQTALSSDAGGDPADILRGTGLWMPVFFVLVPLAILLFWKINLAQGLSLHLPRAKYLCAGVLLGLCAWVPAAELGIVQNYVLKMPSVLVEHSVALAEAIRAIPLPLAILYLALIPAVCEELLFRGFLLSGLAQSAGKWTSIVVTGVIFGIFHFIIFRMPVTACLGMVLAYLCWQSRSIWPGVIMHAIHNTVGVLSVVHPEIFEAIGISSSDTDQSGDHLPILVIAIAAGLIVIGWLLVRDRARAANFSSRGSP